MNITRDEKTGRLYVEGKPALLRYIKGEKIKNKYGQNVYYPGPVGLVLAWPDEYDNICISYSKTNINKGDRFDRDRGIQIAVGRAQYGQEVQYPFDEFGGRLQEELTKMYYRANNYYRYLRKEKKQQQSLLERLYEVLSRFYLCL